MERSKRQVKQPKKFVEEHGGPLRLGAHLLHVQQFFLCHNQMSSGWYALSRAWARNSATFQVDTHVQAQTCCGCCCA